MTTFAPVGQEDPMSTLCRMVVDTQYEDLPQGVVDYAKLHILDTLAVIMGGSAMEGIPPVVDMVKDKGGKPESIIPFYGGKVPASEVALAIGPMARAMDLGDCHEEAGHSAEYTLPAILAATGLKDKVTGRELITAFVVGQEVLIRIGMACKRISRGAVLGRGGGHYIFGPSAGAGKLLGLNLDQLENAQGIARGMTQPHDLAMYRPPTLMVRLHHGLICQAAVNACLLARRGITGPRQEVLLGPRGFLAMATWETEPAALTRRLGEEWEMLGTMMKPYASCKCTHTAVGGVLGQMREHNFNAQDIANIHIDECPLNWDTVCVPREVRWNPQTVPECQFSMPYAVAAAAYDKGLFLDSYTLEARGRPDVRGLMARISASEDSSLPKFSARVSISLKDGKKYSNVYRYVKGDRRNPFTEQELVEKFKRCAAYSAYKLSDEVVDSVIEAILRLDEVDDVVGALLLPLTPK